MIEKVLENGEVRLKKSIDALESELALIRSGRANPALLNLVKVSYYGALTPLSQMASITVPEPQLLVIKPYDKSVLKDIEKAIQTSDLNLTPMNDGVVIRLNFPALTEDRRRELVKKVKTIVENSKVSMRNIRRDLNDEVKKLEKSENLSEDEVKYYIDEIQKKTDDYIKKVDLIGVAKEKTIMEI